MSYSVQQSIDYCKLFATSHYENFTVASRLLPKRFRAAFYVIYAFCRWADDLGDETESPEKALELLNDWEMQLKEMLRGLQDEEKEKNRNSVSEIEFHPIIIALGSIIKEFELPRQPFLDLLIAFRSDQKKQTFQTLDDLELYCRFSANPVGRILLFLFLKTPTARQLQYSDQICTALQWANFWQDVRRDREKSRDYLPWNIQQKYQTFPDQIKELVELTRQKFEAGRPLLKTLSGRFRFEISLFLEGGLAILKKIEKIQFRTDKMRPILSRNEKIRVFFHCLFRWILNR